jgi:hypothetical protein
VGVVRELVEDAVPAAHLRGVTRWEPAVQAALVAVLERYGPAGLDDALPGRVDATGERTSVEVFGHGPVPPRVLVDVVEEQLPDAMLSCGAAPTPHRGWTPTLRTGA